MTRTNLESGAHWDTIEVCGLRSNIQAGTTYHVRAALRGSKVELAVNDILVISTRFRRSIPKPSSAGLFCGSFAQVTAADFRVHAERPRAFVVMQLSEESTHVYLDVIKAVCAEFGITAIRADEIYGPGVIVTDIVEQVIGAHLVIADISSPNANVYFEVGYALASDKPIVLLAKRARLCPSTSPAFVCSFTRIVSLGKPRLRSACGSILLRCWVRQRLQARPHGCLRSSHHGIQFLSGSDAPSSGRLPGGHVAVPLPSRHRSRVSHLR